MELHPTEQFLYENTTETIHVKTCERICDLIVHFVPILNVFITAFPQQTESIFMFDPLSFVRF